MRNKHSNWTLILIMIAFTIFSPVIMIRAEKSIALTSPAFANGNPIPSTYARFDAHPRGLNYSPPLSWINLPAGTKSLALICTDPDGNNWIHWVLYNIPPDINHLNEKLPQNPVLSNHSRQGKNSWGLIGYDGPAPPPGTGIHHYYFKLYVLDTILNLPAGVTASQLLSAMKSHLLGQGELMGTYQYLK